MNPYYYKVITSGVILSLALAVSLVEIKVGATPQLETVHEQVCTLYFHDRNLGDRPCLLVEENSVRYIAFLSEDKKRIDLILMNRGNGLEVYYVSEQLIAAANGSDA